jgi:hypothetical protein
MLLNPQNWNKYAYARNNPLRYVDPNGETATVSTSCTTSEQGNMTCDVRISASIALYSASPGDPPQNAVSKLAAPAIQKSIQNAWSGSFTRDGISYNVSTQVSVSAYASESDARNSGAQNFIGISANAATSDSEDITVPRGRAPIAGMQGIDTGVWSFNSVVSGAAAAHEFAHLLGVDDHSGSVLSNTNFLNDSTLPRKATSSDFGWALQGTTPNFNARYPGKNPGNLRDVQTVHTPWLGWWK